MIRAELARRQQKNKRYSLRALAQALGASPGHLSLVMAGKRQLSESKAAVFGSRLGFSDRRRRLFVSLVRLANAKTVDEREQALRDIRDYTSASLAGRLLTADEFELVAGWHHHALVAIARLGDVNLKNAKHLRRVAKSLGLTVTELSFALARLLRLGLLIDDGKRLKASDVYRYGDIPSAAIRSFHRQALARATRAIEEQDFKTRDLSVMTIAIDPKSYPAITAKIRETINAIMNGYQTDRPKAVYQLSAQLFRVY